MKILNRNDHNSKTKDLIINFSLVEEHCATFLIKKIEAAVFERGEGGESLHADNVDRTLLPKYLCEDINCVYYLGEKEEDSGTGNDSYKWRRKIQITWE